MTPRPLNLSIRGPWRIWTSEPALLSNLRDFLSRLGYQSSVFGCRTVAVATAGTFLTSRAAADELRASVALWTLGHPGVDAGILTDQRARGLTLAA